MKLDYTLDNINDRVDYTKLVTSSNETLSHWDLQNLADYILDALPKEERKNKKILTKNRLVTVDKRETSYQGLAEKLEGGEDSIYGMLSTLGKSALLTPKISITDEDIQTIPGLAELKKNIEEVEDLYKRSSGKQKFLLKKQIIEMRQQQYILKDCFTKPSRGVKKYSGLGLTKLDLSENIRMVEGEPISDCIVSLFRPEHVSALLRNYWGLKQEVEGKFNSDMWYLMLDLDNLIKEVLEEKNPALYRIFIDKADKLKNKEIKQHLKDEFNIDYSVEYISSLWRGKIPKLISEKAKENYILYYYTYEEYGHWKQCSRCGEVKLAHNRWFSKNKTSKDNFYSICKECRNRKG